MLSTTNSRVTNYSAMMPMLTGIGGLLAWLLPTHCLHSLEKLLPLQRAFRQCVGHVQAMMSALPGGLLAFLVPTDCLRYLENWPLFRERSGNPEAIYPLYDNVRQQPDGNYAFDFGSFYTDFLSWTGQPFLSPLKQIEMATSKGPSAHRTMNDPAYEHTRENMAESRRAGKAANVVRDLFRDLTSYAKDAEVQSRLLTVLKRASLCFNN